jgi:hypothetical protein
LPTTLRIEAVTVTSDQRVRLVTVIVLDAVVLAPVASRAVTVTL